jgi:hypothetical protein
MGIGIDTRPTTPIGAKPKRRYRAGSDSSPTHRWVGLQPDNNAAGGRFRRVGLKSDPQGGSGFSPTKRRRRALPPRRTQVQPTRWVGLQPDKTPQEGATAASDSSPTHKVGRASARQNAAGGRYRHVGLKSNPQGGSVETFLSGICNHSRSPTPASSLNIRSKPLSSTNPLPWCDPVTFTAPSQ